MLLRVLYLSVLFAVSQLAPPFSSPALARDSQVVGISRHEIPFDTARVDVDGDKAVLTWSAPGVGAVRIYSGSNASGTRRGRLVGTGADAGSLTLDLAPVGSLDRRYFLLVPDRGAPLVVAPRGLGLASAHNLRDLGGHRTTDGRWVRLGRIFRSDQMDRWSDPDLASVGGLGIGVIADLRTQRERDKEPDRVPAGARHIVLDVMASDDATAGAMREIAEGRGEQMMLRAYGGFVSLPSARSAYRGLFSELQRGSAPVLYHCTAGKDRTGWASVVTLMVLGVSREDAVADYLASNSYLVAKNEKLYAAMSQIPRDHLEPVFGVKRSFIDASFAEVERRHGSFDAYVRDGLGLSASDIRKLRRRYLAGRPQS